MKYNLDYQPVEDELEVDIDDDKDLLEADEEWDELDEVDDDDLEDEDEEADKDM